jgi:NADH-quinone oxidoreductase subunit C
MKDTLRQKIVSHTAGSAEQSADDTLNIRVEAVELRKLFLFLRDECGFDYLVFMTALDRMEKNRLELVYRLFSYEEKASLVVRAELDRGSPSTDTISDLFPTAQWHEREATDMFGIVFVGHPDPRTILLPDGFKGFPLRKDFTHENLIPLPEV